jgi:hypothetical protein
MKAEPEFHAEWLRDEPYDNRSGIIYPGCLVPTLSWKQGTWDSERAYYLVPLSDSLFSFSWKKRPFAFWAAFSRLVPSYSL